MTSGKPPSLPSAIAAAIVLLTMVAAAVVSIRQAVEATRQRDRALLLAGRNEAVVGFLADMLMEVAPADQPIRVADLLERSREMLLNEGVFVTGFGYPVVPKGTARVRCQISAAHTRADLDEALAAFKKVGTRLRLI